ncbi:MAG: hypothetical protein PHR06_13650 [Candidatus Cloacimonetes bacterium]|nr:hypothetical protein [Candidatus Cloacimonadota bacterium]
MELKICILICTIVCFSACSNKNEIQQLRQNMKLSFEADDFDNSIKYARKLINKDKAIDAYEILVYSYYMTNNDTAYFHLKKMMELKESYEEMHFYWLKLLLKIAYRNEDKQITINLLNTLFNSRIIYETADLYQEKSAQILIILNRSYIPRIESLQMKNNLSKEEELISLSFFAVFLEELHTQRNENIEIERLVKTYLDLFNLNTSHENVYSISEIDGFPTLKSGLLTLNHYFMLHDDKKTTYYDNPYLKNFLTQIENTETDDFIYIYENILHYAAAFLRRNGELDKSIEIIDLILQKAPMDEEKAEYYNFTKTIFLFEKGEYAEVIKKLSPFDYSYLPNYAVQFFDYYGKEHLYISDFLLAKSYYQLNEPELAKESYKRGIRFLREQNLYEANYKDILADSLLMKISEVVVKQEPSS